MEEKKLAQDRELIQGLMGILSRALLPSEEAGPSRKSPAPSPAKFSEKSSPIPQRE